MGKNIETGSASAVITPKEPTIAPGLDRLQGSGQQPVNEAQDGTWIICYLHPRFNEWWPEMFYTYQSAVIRWRETGGYLCKNHTPV
jgi:hypothetical protein